jgi:hypothetical protein
MSRQDDADPITQTTLHIQSLGGDCEVFTFRSSPGRARFVAGMVEELGTLTPKYATTQDGPDTGTDSYVLAVSHGAGEPL